MCVGDRHSRFHDRREWDGRISRTTKESWNSARACFVGDRNVISNPTPRQRNLNVRLLRVGAGWCHRAIPPALGSDCGSRNHGEYGGESDGGKCPIHIGNVARIAGLSNNGSGEPVTQSGYACDQSPSSRPKSAPLTWPSKFRSPMCGCCSPNSPSRIPKSAPFTTPSWLRSALGGHDGHSCRIQ